MQVDPLLTPNLVKLQSFHCEKERRLSADLWDAVGRGAEGIESYWLTSERVFRKGRDRMTPMWEIVDKWQQPMTPIAELGLARHQQL